MPMMLKGPTGCGKTRFVEYMAWRLQKPLITVACNEDMTASDLVGRFLLDSNGTRWQDGPLAVAARHGAICYLDEVVEARQDTTVVIHPLTDARRVLPLEKKGELIQAHPDFQIVISYNPGYQSLMKDLKQSTKQRLARSTSTIRNTIPKPKSSRMNPASAWTWRRTWCTSASARAT
jgi:nitric oxide reductase NorQ protein